jgi:hypothetical protein
MTTPMPVYLEPWVNSPVPPAFVPAGAAGAAAGVSQVWTMDGNWAAYPDAQPAPPARPPRLFRIYDPADPREIMWVTNTGGAVYQRGMRAGERRAGTGRAVTNTWTVTRSAEGSVPGVAHAPGFEVRPFLTKASLDGRARGNYNGLIWRNRQSPTIPQVPARWTDTGDKALCQVNVPAGEAIPGSLYELHAWGYYETGMTSINMGVDWGPATAPVYIGNVVRTPAGAAGTPAWRVHAAVNIHGNPAVNATCSVSIMWWCALGNQSLAVPVFLYGNLGEPVINTAVDAECRLQCSKPGGGAMIVQGTRAGRAA